MKELLQQLSAKSAAAIEQAQDYAALEELRVKYLGKKGELTALLKQMGKLSAEERPAMGQLANEVRAALEAELERILRQGYATDAEEFVDGLVCVAVPVWAGGRRQVRSAVALQAPSARMPLAQALQQVPRLSAAALALGRTWA